MEASSQGVSGSDSGYHSPRRDQMSTNPSKSSPRSDRSPCLLVIRDGWGSNPHPEHASFNAVRLAETPVADALMDDWPTALLKTSGPDVGLPLGADGPVMGNSEVGHQNIGAGRIVDAGYACVRLQFRRPPTHLRG